MIIPIDEQYRIASDQHCWMIQRLRGRAKANEWQSIKWYATFPQAVNGLAQLMIRTSEAQTLAEALAEVDRVCTSLSQALPGDLYPRIKEGAA